MIITKIMGGLGNQMFEYAIARSMAQRNNDIFKLDISYYSKPKQELRTYELNLFNIDETIATEQEYNKLRRRKGFLFNITKAVNALMNRQSFYRKEKEDALFDEEVYNLKGNIYLDGYWQNEKYFKEIREQLIEDFTPKSDISEKAQGYLKDIENTNSVSLHIRRGDYISDLTANNFHGVTNIEYYNRAVDYVNDQVSEPVYYIFSDDIAWCKNNFDFLENKIFVDDTSSAIDDLELMKRCKHNIIANSSFSWWAAWLNENSNKIVITPKVWFSAKIDLHLAPEEWIRL